MSHPLNLYKVPDGVMQIFVKSAHLNHNPKKVYVVVSFCDLIYQTTVSNKEKKEWYEGFEFKVTYHQQLFDFVNLDVYEKNAFFPDKLIGKVRIKISSLFDNPEVTTKYFELVSDGSYSYSYPPVLEDSLKKLKIGAILTRINYRYQKLEDPDPEFSSDKNIPTIFNSNLDKEIKKLQSDAMKLIDSRILYDGVFSEFSNRYFESLDNFRQIGDDLVATSESDSSPAPLSHPEKVLGHSSKEFNGFTKEDNTPDTDNTSSEIGSQSEKNSYNSISNKEKNDYNPRSSIYPEFPSSLYSLADLSISSTVDFQSESIASSKKKSTKDKNTSPNKTIIPSVNEIHKSSNLVPSEVPSSNILTTFIRIMNVLVSFFVNIVTIFSNY
ncbi:hypothetical protein AYI68_g5163 [Smittium mucronatum]|uniref:C2 domain-containing protein n=1 Tax=Smittium mucronatum TaxID=133383 RepID=A0A1R0GV03_9FUNG|nr:hypothetical protein AYI68_g5163 [Smittium mucronatum]